MTINRLPRRQALKLTLAGLATVALRPAAFAAARSKVPSPRTTVRRHRSRPQFFLNGRPYTKPVFETYVPQSRFFRQFAEAGTDVFCFSTNLGPGFGAPTWLGPEQWDFKALDELAHRVLEGNPRVDFDSAAVPSQTARQSGRNERTLRFPKAADLFDPFTGLRLARRATKFVHPFRDKETIILRYAERGHAGQVRLGSRGPGGLAAGREFPGRGSERAGQTTQTGSTPTVDRTGGKRRLEPCQQPRPGARG